MATPNDVLAIARGEVGYIESGGAGGHSGNITKYWAELAPSLQGQPWCAGFVSWVFKHAAAPLPPAPWKWGYSYVGALVDLARKSGWVIPGPRPGAIVCFGDHHTEVCTSGADANGNFGTIGGNTSSGSSGSQTNGGGVYARTRNVNGSGIGPCVFVWPPVYGAPQPDPPSGPKHKEYEAMIIPAGESLPFPVPKGATSGLVSCEDFGKGPIKAAIVVGHGPQNFRPAFGSTEEVGVGVGTSKFPIKDGDDYIRVHNLDDKGRSLAVGVEF